MILPLVHLYKANNCSNITCNNCNSRTKTRDIIATNFWNRDTTCRTVIFTIINFTTFPIPVILECFVRNIVRTVTITVRPEAATGVPEAMEVNISDREVEVLLTLSGTCPWTNAEIGDYKETELRQRSVGIKRRHIS